MDSSTALSLAWLGTRSREHRNGPAMTCTTTYAQRKVLSFCLSLCIPILGASTWAADNNKDQSDLAQRLTASAKVLDQVMATPEKAIPTGIISSARCVAVFPSTIQVAVLVGAKHGKGFATCRTSNGWSAPAPLDISGGSWGAQLGGQAVDLVLIVTDDKGVQQLESGKFNLGTETSVTGGPIGKEDMKMNADVLSYSQARGVFAGTNFNGSSITEDQSDTRRLYGNVLSLADLFSGKAQPPSAGQSFLDTVQKYAGQSK
jgi:lipid-binding SYLF domain-containing protein